MPLSGRLCCVCAEGTGLGAVVQNAERTSVRPGPASGSVDVEVPKSTHMGVLSLSVWLCWGVEHKSKVAAGIRHIPLSLTDTTRLVGPFSQRGFALRKLQVRTNAEIVGNQYLKLVKQLLLMRDFIDSFWI